MGTGGMDHMGNGVQGYGVHGMPHGQWGTGGMGHMGNGAHSTIGYRGMGHMGNGVQGQWVLGVWTTWAMGHIAQ